MAPHGQTVGYVRVSSADQNLALEHRSDRQSPRGQSQRGSRNDRRDLIDCLSYIRDGDLLRVASMDRLARSLVDLQQIVDEIVTKGVSVRFVKENQ